MRKAFMLFATFLILPGILAIIAYFQGYMEDTLTMNSWQSMMTKALPFLVIIGFIGAIFMWIRGKNRDGR